MPLIVPPRRDGPVRAAAETEPGMWRPASRATLKVFDG